MPSFDITLPVPGVIRVRITHEAFDMFTDIDLRNPANPALTFRFRMRLMFQVKDINFHLSSAVLLPVDKVEGETFSTHDDGYNVFSRLAQALTIPLHFESISLFITGHTDTSGDKASINDPLSLARAFGVYNLLMGNQAQWVANIADPASPWHKWQRVKDYQLILQWAALEMGWDCNPGPITNELNQATKNAIISFKTAFNIEWGSYPDLNNPGTITVNSLPDNQMWQAIYYLYERAIRAEIIGIPPANLKEYDSTDTANIILTASAHAIGALITHVFSGALMTASVAYTGPYAPLASLLFTAMSSWFNSLEATLKDFSATVLTSGMRPSAAVLQYMRGRVSDDFFTPSQVVGCSELYPIEKPEEDGYVCATNRRVEINYFLRNTPWTIPTNTTIFRNINLPAVLGVTVPFTGITIGSVTFQADNPVLTCTGTSPSCSLPRGSCPMYCGKLLHIEIPAGRVEPASVTGA